MGRTPDLSQEILEEVISYLDGDTDTLMALSTSSYRVWHICRPLLFYSLHFSAENCAKWAGYLGRTDPTPTLDHLEFVQELTVDLKNFSDADEMHVAPIVDRITCPRVIKLENTSPYSTGRWSSLSTWLQCTISELISRPTVRDVRVRELIYLPTSLFAGHLHLWKLQLISCTFTMPPLGPIVLRPDFPKTPLRTLYINSTSFVPYAGQRELEGLAEHPFFPLDLADLSQLHIHLTPLNVAQVQHLLLICGPHLVSMSITLNGGSNHIQHLSSLRALHFHLTIPVFATEDEVINDISSGLLRTLEHLSDDYDGSRHPLEEIAISVNLSQDNFQMFPARFWADLDTLLVNLAPIKSLVVSIEGGRRVRQLSMDVKAYISKSHTFWETCQPSFSGRQYRQVSQVQPERPDGPVAPQVHQIILKL
ncbi:hypothetical protein BDN72DRAFT_907104 [Pluteus cervinus]|uniref:Uncharacterized protein n=1 Tax=Pluteus cervinus TaxID=181527 RepID=A0ACD2ZXJ1_9AGAR|nr:hypothetical protein BDN72DRAFT_907104 [Pluteus cervinus]